MPRYLGINYWQNVIDQRQEFYSRALLTVPNHLKEVNCNFHSKGDQILGEEIQWRRCRDIGPFEDVGASYGASLDFSGSTTVGPEKYDWSTEIHKIKSEMVEVVPSSNPESIYSFVSDELFDSFDLLDDTCEMFEKEDLTKYTRNKEKGFLEDLVTSNGLKEIRNNIPQLSVLLSRLHPKSVKDPLADEAGSIFTEEMYFKNHFKPDRDDCTVDVTEENDSSINELESFEKASQLSVKDGALEEILSPPSKHIDLDVHKLHDICSDVKVFIQKETEEFVDQQGDVELLSNMCTTGMEEPDLTLSPVQSLDFISINNHALDDDKFERKAILESPVVNPDLVCKSQLHRQTLHDMLQDLKPSSPEIQNTVKIFLRQFEKETIMTRLWQHEKFFDEIVALRLPEPDTDGLDRAAFSQATVGDLMHQLHLEEVSGLGAVELQLCWDPWSNSKALITQAACTEQLPQDDLKEYFDVKEVETFAKHSQDQFMSDTNPSVTWNDEKGLVSKAENHLQESCPSTSLPQMEKTSAFQPLRDDFNNCVNKRIEETQITGNQPVKVTPTADQDFLDYNPLQVFVMMRSSENQQICEKTNAKNNSKAINIEASKEKAVVKNLVNTGCSGITDVEFTGQFEQVLDALYGFGSPYVDVLKRAGEIPKHVALPVLQLDLIRFLVKQKEKQEEDKQQGENGYDLYKSLLVVYAVVGAAELLIHCCLESAISHLSAVHEKYQNSLGSSLDEIRKELFQFKVQFDQTVILHPKVATLCRHVEDFLKSTSENYDKKVLVVVKRNLSSLWSCLEKALSLSGNIRACIINTPDEITYTHVAKHNCIIVYEAAIDEGFKWSPFHLVLEFESGTDILATKCKCENVTIVSLRSTCLHKKEVQKFKQVSSNLNKTPDIKVTVIGSQHLTRQKNLLQLLESRHNIAVMERNYDGLSSKCPFADIILDERHCIVLHNLSGISEEWQIEHLSRKLLSLALQYTHCWLIFYSATSNLGGYELPKPVVTNMCKLEAAIANLNSNSERYQIFYKVLMAYNLEHLAEVVRMCCDICIETSTVWMKDQWSREWITGEASQDERFLLGLPCLNSFSAQFLLSKTSLGNLLSYTIPELKRTAAQLPEKVLLTFYKVVNISTGLHLRFQENILHDQNVPEQQVSGMNGPQSGIEHDTTYINKVQAVHYQDDESESQIKVTPPSGILRELPVAVCHGESNRGKGCFSTWEKYETQVSFNQFTNDSGQGDSQDTKPNQYVLAQIEGIAKNGTKQDEEFVVPDFDLINCSDILYHTSDNEKRNKFSQGHRFHFDETDDKSGTLLAQSRQSIQNQGIENQGIPVVDTLQCISELTKDKMKERRKPSFSAAIHEKQNIIMENFTTNTYQNSHQDNCFTGSTPNVQDMFDKQNDCIYIPERCVNDHTRNQSIPKLSSFDCHNSSSYIPSTSTNGHFSANHSWTNSLSYLSRSTRRKPVLSEHFQNRIKMPPAQRVSIGLAQPLRRHSPHAQKGYPAVLDTKCRWLTESSPPMDLGPDSPSDVPFHETKNKYSDDGRYTGKLLPKSHREGGLFNNDFTFDDFPNKRKKLTYKPLPGRRAGQTILAFR